MATTNVSGRAASLRAHSSPALCLVPPMPRPPCAETVQFCENLLEAARTGFTHGVALVMARKGRSYSVEACGDFREDPTYARGAVAALDDELRELVKEKYKASQ